MLRQNTTGQIRVRWKAAILESKSCLCALTTIICWAVLVGCSNLLRLPGFFHQAMAKLITHTSNRHVRLPRHCGLAPKSLLINTHARVHADWLVVWQPWQRCGCCGPWSEHYLHRWTQNRGCCRCGGGALDGACYKLSRDLPATRKQRIITHRRRVDFSSAS